MGFKAIMLINAAVLVALAAGMVAYKFVRRAPSAPGSQEVLGMSRTKLAIKLIILGLVLFLGLAVYYLYERGGG